MLDRHTLAAKPSDAQTKRAPKGARGQLKDGEKVKDFGVITKISYTENEEPQPQVVAAFGFRMTNWAPSRPSL